MNKNIGYLLVALGVIAALVALFADQLGLGNKDGFGLQQTGLLVVGLVVAAVGGFLSTRSPSTAS